MLPVFKSGISSTCDTVFKHNAVSHMLYNISIMAFLLELVSNSNMLQNFFVLRLKEVVLPHHSEVLNNKTIKQ